MHGTKSSSMSEIEKRIFKSKNGKDVTIRNAMSWDAKQTIGINRSVIAEGLFMLRESDEANYTLDGESKNIQNYLHDKGCLYIVAEIENTVGGFLEFRRGGFRRTSHSGMFSMFILKEFREIGIGRMLLSTLIEWGEKNPLIEKITLSVFSTNHRAQTLYKKLGFVEEGRCPKDMKLSDGTYIDSVLMYRFVK